MSAEFDKLIEELNDETVRAILAKVRSGEATASDLNVARQFLKDNYVQTVNTPGSRIAELYEEFEDDEFMLM